MKFINRKDELSSLNNKWRNRGAQLVVIYGKRRVGKTELIKQFLKNKQAVYFLADKRSKLEQLRELGQLVGRHFKDELLIKNGFNGWLDVFIYLKKNVKKRFILAIDEYPYLLETDTAVNSLFQKGWDEYLKNSRTFLILSGSSVSMMETEILGYKSPLYGRRTGQILLLPMSFSSSRQFFENLLYQRRDAGLSASV
jgi:AAA+ ATPase superfamily predicted ATPase